MNTYTFTAIVKAPTREHAIQVMSERFGYDEVYDDEDGNEFDYELDWAVSE